MTTTPVLGIHPVLVTAAVTLISVMVGAVSQFSFMRNLEARKRVAQAKLDAYNKIIRTLELIRYYYRIDRLHDVSIRTIRQHHKSGSSTREESQNSLDQFVADQINDIKERRDRTFEHVFRPLLEVEAKVAILGSGTVNTKLAALAKMVRDSVLVEDYRFDDKAYNTALDELKNQIRSELKISP
jgi:hypothetical protein